MKITEIYTKYKIPPNLQLHQLRVAAVALIICDNFENELDRDSIITACLLHDMGNILKFNFEVFPDEFYAPKGRDYWKSIKEEFKQKYGDDEHDATESIAEDLNISSQAMHLLKSIGFRKAQATFKSHDYNLKVTCYSDHRVNPFGVTSMKDRFEDGRERNIKNRPGKYTREGFDELATHWYKVEKQIFEYCKIKPEDITDVNVNPLIEELKSFEI